MRPLRLSYLLWVGLACGQNANSTEQNGADAVRDLLVDRISWKPVASQSGVRHNEHQFRVTNTSSQYAYRQIRLRFDYFDAHYQRIKTERYTLDQSIKARSAVAIPPVRVGVAYPSVKSATVRVEQAQSD